MKIITTMLIVLGALTPALRADEVSSSTPAPSLPEAAWSTVVIDIACDGRTYVSKGLHPETGLETRGSTYIVNGKLFPGGTIPDGDGFDLDGTPGSTGQWVCFGTWNFSLEEVLEGAIPHVSSTQHFTLPGQGSLMTEGPEGGHEPVERVVLGGTGQYRGVIGEVHEELIGFNSTGFENFRCTFKIRQIGR